MADTGINVIILAAGKGTRMKSSLHKVLHAVGGKPMLSYLMETVSALGTKETILVVGSGKEQLEAAYPHAKFVTQAEQLGTGHAARVAVDAMGAITGPVIVLFGDVPFIPLSIMQTMTAKAVEAGTGIVALGFTPADAGRYGRMIVGADGCLERIVEYKDASDAERAVTLCNSGMMVINGTHAQKWLHALSNENAAGEYYLTDLVALARKDGQTVQVVEADEADVLGINSRADLAHAEKVLQTKWRRAALDAGVTMTDPDTVYFSADTKIAHDVTIEPGVFFGPGVTIETGATIKAYSHLEGAYIKAGASIGPFARLRPGADIGADAKIGNFVEVKKATIDTGAKVSHLSYIGDATIGADANIGAGTITCNYDGFLKYQTIIGAGAFIGSNSALVAPVKIGDGAIIGAGSVITQDVSPDALGVARGKQHESAGYATTFRTKKAAEKANKSKG
ncbi:bifunctional UDP-N-acetylglucosamine diphosphorylase/glucosamine-1-phosphate N-acetyltransferase GlmU [Kordiimonas pumila]|uniref:Bifunctional protein GlmU n=1 Tax=Kordiimonas pumila TaxID=2161677 RepID=A0ABV7D4U6_9PROT